MGANQATGLPLSAGWISRSIPSAVFPQRHPQQTTLKRFARNPFYETMREVSPGDVIFSFSDTFIAAIGIPQSYCFESPKPAEFGTTGQHWAATPEKRQPQEFRSSTLDWLCPDCGKTNGERYQTECASGTAVRATITPIFEGRLQWCDASSGVAARH